MFHCADIGNGRFYLGDCLEVMPTIPDGVVDLVLCDLPYGTTQNKWDSVLPFDRLWEQYDRLCAGACVLSAAQPFTSTLVMSRLERFKYQWVWQKEAGTGLLNAKKQPLRDHEDLLVFYGKQCVYNPQMSVGKPYVCKKGGETENYNSSGTVVTVNEGTRCPKTVLQFKRDRNKMHPTQKPVALWEYLIRTYTNPDDLVLDNCAGSGTTAIAAENTGRRWVCIEKEEKYAVAALDRIKTHLETINS